MSSPGVFLDAPPETSPLVNALRVVRERWWIVAVTTVVTTVGLLALALTETKQYEATSSILIRASTLTDTINPTAQQNFDPVREAATNLLLVKSTAVAELVRKQLNDGATTDALLEQVDAVAEPDADLIDITVTDPDPARAAAVANAFADQFRAFIRSGDQESAEDGAKQLRARIAALPPNAVAARAELQQALEAAITLQAVATGNAKVVDRATVPSTASSPQPKRALLLGLVLGLGLGVALAFLVDLFDRRIKTIEDFEAMYGFRALTSIPYRTRDPSTQRDRQAALEPFRILRNGLGFLSTTREIRVVLVTSAVQGEGKSTVAAGLARAMALAGQRVVLIEADLRRPTFHQQFDLGGDTRGLTTALVGGTPVADLLRPVLPGLRTLTVLPSGPTPPNSAELLRGEEMAALLVELKTLVDVIILDAPPLLPVADTQVLLDHPQVDACLVVGRAYESTRDEVRRTRAVLDRHQMRNYGLVVNGLRELDGGYDYYGASNTKAGALQA